MALQMPRPFTTKSGSYYLNVKVPLALRELARGQRVSLPVAGEQCSVVIGDKVFLSLRTKEARVAKERFPLALNALNAFYESLGQPPQSLGRADVRALAGDIYKQAVHEIDHDDARASELAEWTREQVELDEDISPNHGWRHTFITRAEEAGIKKRYVNAICGHNHGKDVSDGYFSARPKALKVRIDAYPRYELDGVVNVDKNSTTD